MNAARSKDRNFYLLTTKKEAEENTEKCGLLKIGIYGLFAMTFLLLCDYSVGTAICPYLSPDTVPMQVVAELPHHLRIPKPPKEMIASYYGDPFHGRTTASGAVYDKNELTAAHRTMKFGTRLMLLNPFNGKQVEVEITDRGPYSEWKGVKYYDGRRDIDLSEAAANRLGVKEQGVAVLVAWEIE